MDWLKKISLHKLNQFPEPFNYILNKIRLELSFYTLKKIRVELILDNYAFF